MLSNRILRHVIFWLFFFCISLFNELYFSSSWSAHPDWASFFSGVIAQVLMFSIKVVVVYYSIYSILPRWSAQQTNIGSHPFAAPNKTTWKYVVEFIAVLIIGAFCMRLMVQGVIWVYIFPGDERDLTWNSLIGRYLYSLFDLLPITLVAVAIKLFQMQMRALRQETILVQEKLKSELGYLKAQTNPHFLFNTLNVIYGLSRKQDEQTPKAIMSLSKILRYMLYETSHRVNPVTAEVQIINDYIALQKLRFQEHMALAFEHQLENPGAEISPLLLLPLVENAFKHSDGIDTVIEIRITERGGVLEFFISNSISAPSATGMEIKDGIGLSNVRRQLAILYKEYTFSASKKDDKFEVDLTIDLNSYQHV